MSELKTAEEVQTAITGLRSLAATRELDPVGRIFCEAILGTLDVLVKWQTEPRLLPILGIGEACSDVMEAIEKALADGSP